MKPDINLLDEIANMLPYRVYQKGREDGVREFVTHCIKNIPHREVGNTAISRIKEEIEQFLQKMMLTRPEDCKTDLKGLHELMEKEGIEHIFREHPIAKEEDAKAIIGYNPAGDWQIIIPNKLDWDISIVRGMVSFGYYESYYNKEIKRFNTPEEVVDWIKENYKPTAQKELKEEEGK